MDREIANLGRKIFKLGEENKKRRGGPEYSRLSYQLFRLDSSYKEVLKRLGKCKELEIGLTSRLFGFRTKLDELREEMLAHTQKVGNYYSPHKYYHLDSISKSLDDIECYQDIGNEYAHFLNEYIAHLEGMCSCHSSLEKLFGRRCHRIKFNMGLSCNTEIIYTAKKELWDAYYQVYDSVVCHEQLVTAKYTICECHTTRERPSSPESDSSSECDFLIGSGSSSDEAGYPDSERSTPPRLLSSSSSSSISSDCRRYISWT